ncbi:putative inorganic phosphate cotransporter [Ischnura elegans]|uniref:putative inorganic phosphate cotransporter n=1 Tax=Ischnura elegans TaxID=197161 RepID=UPI001ED89222|nr:putative inorganic phosphate cotransporter [Ischnura elegans]
MSRLMNSEEEILVAHEEIENGEDPSPTEDTKRRIKTRHILAFLGFLGFANVYAMRVNLSVAIVAMTNSTTNESESSLASRHSMFGLYSPLQSTFYESVASYGKNSSHKDVCPKKPRANIEMSFSDLRDTSGGEFPWNERTQGLILGSFFYGYVATQVPGGRLSELFGGRHVVGLGVLLTGVFTLVSPIAARMYWSWGIGPFLVLRIFEGLSEGVTFPAMMAMFAQWVPPLERSRITAIVYAGALFGTVISMPISGILCNIDLPVYWWLLGPGGWVLCFYIFGALGVIWYIAWMALISDSPATHPSICPQERRFIEHSLKQPDKHHHSRGNHATVTSPADDDLVDEGIPWCQVLTSLPLWAILLTMCGQSWAFYTLLTELPTYMDKILHFNIMQNSFLSALPYLLNWLCSLPFSWLADWLLSAGYLSTTASLKIFNSLAVIVPSLSFVGIAYAGCHSNFILALLAISGGFAGAAYSGVQVNHLALSPRLAGTLYGLTNAISNVCGFLAPYATGSIVNGHETITRWRYVFLISAGINLVLNFIYILFASGEVQPWDNPRRNSNTANNPQGAFSRHSVNEDREDESS